MARHTDAQIKEAIRFYIYKQLRSSELMDITTLRHTLGLLEQMSLRLSRLRRLCDELAEQGFLRCDIIKRRDPHFDHVRYGHGPNIRAGVAL